jgi:transposase
VRKFLQAEATPPRSRPPYRGSILDPYKPYILERWKSGCWNGAQLLEEIKKLGYTGSDALFRYFMTHVRKQHQAAGTALALELSTARGSISAPDDLPPKPSRHPPHVSK